MWAAPIPSPSLCPLPQDRLKDLNSQADSLMTSSAFDTSQVKDKRDAINSQFQKIKGMAASRRARLNESHRLHQFFRDMDDEESWIKYAPAPGRGPRERPRAWDGGRGEARQARGSRSPGRWWRHREVGQKGLRLSTRASLGPASHTLTWDITASCPGVW